MNASGNFGIKKQKLIQSGNIPLNYIDNEREVIISFTAVGDNAPLYKFYNYNNQKVGTFTLDSANIHPTNDFLAAADIDNGYYNEEEGYLLSLVRIYWELTPYSASYTTQSYLNGFMKIDLNYNDFTSSTYSIVGYYGDNGNPYVGGFTDSNVNIHYYDETNDLIYLTTGDTTLDAKFEIVDIASPSITQTRGTTANGYVHIIDVDEKNLISEVRIAGTDTTDNLYHNYRYNWNTDTLVISTTSGNAPTVYKDGSRYIEIDTISSQNPTPIGDGSITVRLQDFDCNDITVLAQEDNILSSTPNRVASSEIIGGRSFDNTTRYMISDSSGTYIYTSDQKDNNKVLSSTASKVLSSNCTYLKEVEYTTLSTINGEMVIGIDNNDNYLYTMNTIDNNNVALTIRQYVMGATLSLTQSWSPASKTGIRYSTSPIWDKNKKTFWVTTQTGGDPILNKIKINESMLTASTFLEEITYDFPPTYAGNTTKIAYLKEEANDIVISLSTTDNGLNNVYYVDKGSGTTSQTVDLTYIADSFQIRENLYLSDFNVSYFNTLGYGIAGIPSLNVRYDYNTDTAEVLYSNIDRDNYIFETYLSKNLQRVIYKDLTDDYLKYSVFDFKNDNEYSIVRSGATVSSSLSHIMKRDGHIASFDASNGVYQEFMIDNKVFETGGDPCGEDELDVSTISPFIIEMETDGSNQVSIPILVDGTIGAFDVNWGDGEVEEITTNSTITHTYNQSGIYEIRMYEGIAGFSFELVGNDQIRSIIQFGDIKWKSTFSFRNCSDLVAKYTDAPDFSQHNGILNYCFAGCTKFNGDMDYWDMSNITQLQGFLSGATSFNKPLNSWDVSNVIDMTALFFGCESFNQPLSNWDLSSCTTIRQLFEGAIIFNQPLNSWNTSTVENFVNVFRNTDAFNQPLDKWNTSNVTTMNGMFSGALAFNQPLNTWDTSSVTDMTSMFIDAESFNQDLNNWDTGSVSLMASIFYNAINFNGQLNTWDVSNVTSLVNSFRNAEKFNQPLNNWDTSSVQSLNTTFADATIFNQNLDSWNTSNVTNMASAFTRTDDYNQPMNSWDVGSVSAFNSMFFRALSFSQSLNNWDMSSADNISLMLGDGIFNGDVSSWDVSNITNMAAAFRISEFTGDLSQWDTSSASNMSSMFLNCLDFNSDITGWTVSSVTNMTSMFSNARAFSRDLNSWDTSSVETINNMFFNNLAMGTYSLNNWDTSNVTNMSATFRRANYDGDISQWDTTNVTNMSFMFECLGTNVRFFNQDISSWTVSNVENMALMFNGNQQFNQDISGWDVGTVTNMDRMFVNADAFDVDISTWDIDQVTNFNDFMFDADGFTTSNYDAILIGWESQAPTSGITIDFGNSKYTGGGAAEAARDSLIGTYSWTISDGGIA